ncbi:MAG TPA: FkbM family methyltransferase [Vicinamibacterales bacterium]|nr:FkbM family methyltransferase [Vicinamibacterales bacterium]
MALPILQGPAAGMWWIAGSHTAGCWLGSYESLNQTMLVRLLKPGDVFFDIGANVGFFTLLASRLVGETGHVYAFEPQRENVAFLQRHLELNAIDNVTVVPCAAWECGGTLRFQGTQATGRIAPDGDRVMNAVAIDDLYHRGELRPPNVVKLDVEGAELQALKGMTHVMKAAHPRLLIEFHRSTIDGIDQDAVSASLLQELGYTLSKLPNDEVFASPSGVEMMDFVQRYSRGEKV